MALLGELTAEYFFMKHVGPLRSLTTTLRVDRRSIPIADIERHAIGDATSAANHVRNRGECVKHSDVDFLRKFDGIVDLDAKVAHGTLDLGVSDQ